VVQTIAFSLLRAEENLLITPLKLRIDLLYIFVVLKILIGHLLPFPSVLQDRIGGDRIVDQVVGPAEPPIACNV
jgi:hypothetical protein